MTPSQNCLRLIDAFEANKLVAYRCPAGVWTIGRGHTSAAGAPHVYPGMAITAAQSDAIFAADVAQFSEQVEALGFDLTQNQFDALVSFAYNVGIGALRKSSVARLLRKGDAAGAANALLAWNRATVNGQRVAVAGLARRRRAEKALFEGDVEAAMAIAGAHRGPMPQAVERPEPAKKLDKSPTTISGVTSAAGGAVVVASQTQASCGASHWLLFVVGALIVVSALVILWRRYGYWLNADKIETEFQEVYEDLEADFVKVEGAAAPVLLQIANAVATPTQTELGIRELMARALGRKS